MDRSRRIILEEDEYAARLASILRRDYFPRLQDLRQQYRYLLSCEARWKNSSLKNANVDSEPSNLPNIYHLNNFRDPQEIINTNNTDFMTVEEFQNAYTTEDSAAFDELVDCINARKRIKSLRAYGRPVFPVGAFIPDPLSSRCGIMKNNSKFIEETSLDVERHHVDKFSNQELDPKISEKVQNCSIISSSSDDIKSVVNKITRNMIFPGATSVKPVSAENSTDSSSSSKLGGYLDSSLLQSRRNQNYPFLESPEVSSGIYPLSKKHTTTFTSKANELGDSVKISNQDQIHQISMSDSFAKNPINEINSSGKSKNYQKSADYHPLCYRTDVLDARKKRRQLMRSPAVQRLVRIRKSKNTSTNEEK